jgi:hypothetical protein
LNTTLYGVAVPVLEPHGDAVLVEGREFRDQAVVQLLCLFFGQEADDGGPSLEDFRPS